MESLLAGSPGRELVARFGRARAKEALGRAAARFRSGEVPDIGLAASRELESAPPVGPRPVINATGVLLHTNLGRAPLAAAAREGALAAAGYCTLEYDLERGERGHRGEHVRTLLLRLFAPDRTDVDALAVNNNAAALLLALDTLANGKRVAVSRGELVAIGGDFRVPSILARSGASLHEVGATNRTTLADYAEALEAGATVVLKVRPSNYRIVGFTEEVPLPDLASLARRHGAPIVYDAGAAAPRRFSEQGLAEEPIPIEALEAGADIVCFSADKTLGGPQAGLMVGTAARVQAAARNPLARALRPDKLVLGALAATLDLHLAGRESDVPFFRMLNTSVEELEARATTLAASLRDAGFDAVVVPTTAIAGGGAGTESELPSRGVAVRSVQPSAADLHAALRSRRLPVIARIDEGRVVLDLLTVSPEEDQEVVRAFSERSGGPRNRGGR